VKRHETKRGRRVVVNDRMQHGLPLLHGPPDDRRSAADPALAGDQAARHRHPEELREGRRRLPQASASGSAALGPTTVGRSRDGFNDPNPRPTKPRRPCSSVSRQSRVGAERQPTTAHNTRRRPPRARGRARPERPNSDPNRRRRVLFARRRRDRARSGRADRSSAAALHRKAVGLTSLHHESGPRPTALRCLLRPRDGRSVTGFFP
jgi:hypothetical protein